MESESPYKSPEAEVAIASGSGDLREEFIGPKNTSYYLNQFDKFDAGGGAIGWHWPAFFVTWFWLAYRKMWAWFFAYWFLFPIVMVLISVTFTTLVDPVVGGLVYFLGYFLIPPLFANRLYYGHAKEKIAKAKISSPDPQAQALAAARLGGTSNVFIFVAVLAVMMIGILAAIAIPAYQDYTIRAQVSEGLNLSGGAKSAVSEFFLDTGSLPADNAEAGLAEPREISGKYTSSVEVYQGEIYVTYGNDAHQLLQGRELFLLPSDTGNSVEWQCASDDIADKHLPAACR